MNLRPIILAVAALTGAGGMTMMADAPSGYYSTCENKSGAALLTALNQKISSHTTVSYNGLWDLYRTSDVKSNGKIWDMYSTKEWNPNGERCGSYKNIGDCYNREHSFPKSWFDDASPMVSDAFHIYPTDGKVNGQRSNYPYGECANGTSVSSYGGVRALGKLGRSTFSGYSGTVFEPDDEYKGDFARSYFYMAACYNDRISSWSSPMLAGNKYPVFSNWALNLLLKWHRQDPVSAKERARNEVVYGRQRNRNPFIDHPDLAEHIWGDKKTVGWSSTGVVEPAIELPVNGSTVNLGYAATGHPVTATVNVRGKNLTQNVSVSISGAGFSVSATSLTAAAANAGTTLTVTFNPQSVGAASGMLTLRSGGATSAVTLRATGVNGIPVSDPTMVTDNSFTFTWTNIDDPQANYSIVVSHNGAALSGYPVTVKAATQSHTVSNLEPETTYTYQVRSQTMVSEVKSATTGAPIPSIEFLYDGDLYFTTEPGTPSEAAELMIDAENIEGNIALTVTSPFQLSTDKTSWSTTVTLLPDEDRFYLRLNSAEAGEFHSTLKAQASNYFNDDVEISGIATSTPDFIETFEQPNETSGYSSATIAGTASQWKLEKVFFNTSSSEAHGGNNSLRFNKSGESSVAMAEDKEHGAGTVTFYARAYRDGEGGTFTLRYSTDGGITWLTGKTFDVTSTSWKEYSATLNVAGNVRIAIERTTGGRACLDDISVTNYAGQSSVAELDYHRWDAFSRSGELVIETYDGLTLPAAVYGTDGITYYNGPVTGEFTLPLPAGLYIAVIDDYARRVVVR